MQSSVVPGMQLGLMLCEMTVAPVVVKPDMDSNHEFTKPRAMSIRAAPSTKGPLNIPPNQYGKEPISTVTGQTKPTPTKASRSRNRSAESVLVNNPNIASPKPPLKRIAGMKACAAKTHPSSHHVSNAHSNNGAVNARSVQPKMRFRTSKRMPTP